MTQQSLLKVPGPVLVTGGAGFIGSHVVEALLARGAEVRVLDDLSSGSAEALPLHDPNLELVTGDVGDPAAVAAALRGMRACIHLAAQPRPARAAADPGVVARANVQGLANVLEAARAQRVPRVLFASSAAVYGEAPTPPFGELARPRPAGPAGMEKLLAEAYAALYADCCGLQTLALRYFNVYGPRQRRRDSVIPRFLEALEAHRPLTLRGDGHQRRDFIHVEDAARATVAALASSARGALNVGSGRPTSIRELARLVGQVLDRQPLMHFVPAGAGEAADSWADVRRLREATGLAPARSLRAGLTALATDRAARRRAMTRAQPFHPLPAPTRVVRLSP